MDRPSAILFDLWGTLVPSEAAAREACFAAMASDLGVDAAGYIAAFRASYRERFTGALGSLDDTVLTLARRCGGTPGDAAVRRAAARRIALTRRLLSASGATLATLDELRRRGFALALVSDSTVETPQLWRETALARRMDAVAFSCVLGVRKPAPELFLFACSSLGVAPGRCAYVGDGDGRELTAASALDMHAVRLRAPREQAADRYDDDDFAGPEVASLQQVLDQPWAQAGPSS
jgi:putative hydrolase of the HAD superfamily